MEKITPFVQNETDPLEIVMLGIATSPGATPKKEEAYDPKSKEHIAKGTYPIETDLTEEIEGFAAVLTQYGVQVFRPDNIENCNQIFARDIAFVIDDKMIIPNMISARAKEQVAIHHFIASLDANQVLRMPQGPRAEGGDVIVWNDDIFIGYEKEPDFSNFITSRTNVEGVDFIRTSFPNKKIHAFELNKSDTIARDNALHLDCCFQPIGTDKAIIHREGFKNEADFLFLMDYFGADNCLIIDKEEMYNMGSNVFSISPEVIVSERRLTRINNHLRSWGFKVEEIKYNETAKMEGLLRCSTMPIKRSNK